KSLALEVAPHGVRVVAIAPVATETPMLATFMGKKEVDAEGMARYVATVPLGRLNRPEDIAHAAVFLASDEAAMITGACLEVAGRTGRVKDRKRMVAGGPARRGEERWRALGPVARVVSADGCRRRTLELELRVSAPLPHGVDGSPLGAIVMLTVVDPGENERFVFASDVQGPLSPVAAAYLIAERPTLLYLSGPPSYIERDVGTAVIERGIDNLLRIVGVTGCRVIMDHHALRDTRFTE